MTKQRKRLTPRTARTIEEICSLPRNTVETKLFWILVEMGEVTIA